MPNPSIPDFRVHSRGYLPHFEQRGMTYFVTFRLADSLPVSVLKKFKEDLAASMRCIRPKDSALQTEVEPVWSVMPNHVHVLFRPFTGESLEKILHSWKSYSAKQANAILHRQGAFWQPEYYDHLVRSEDEFYRIQEYILDNPIAAGLRDWKWVGFGNIFATHP